MSEKSILILGGYGNTGRLLAEYLLHETDVQLVIAGRNLEKAGELAQYLNTRFEGQRVTGLRADASDQAGLCAAFSRVDIVVVAASTSAFVRQVATAALEAGIDYLDVQYSSHKMAVLQAMASHIEAAGCCFITDGGFHPGLPAALVRYVAPCFEVLESARVGSVIKMNWSGLDVGQATMVELIGEFTDVQMLAFRHGRWQQAGLMAMLKPVTMDFGREFGRQYAVPMFLEEIRAIPELIPGIQETGFYVGGFNGFTDWFVSPLVMLGLKLAPQRGLWPLARLYRWSLNHFFPSPLRHDAQSRGPRSERRPGQSDRFDPLSSGWLCAYGRARGGHAPATSRWLGAKTRAAFTGPSRRTAATYARYGPARN